MRGLKIRGGRGPDRRRSRQFDVRLQKGAAFTRSQAPMTATAERVNDFDTAGFGI